MQGHVDIILSYRRVTKGKEEVGMNGYLWCIVSSGLYMLLQLVWHVRCTCTPVVDVSFVQAAPWFPGLWVASDWQRPCGVLSNGVPIINRSRCVTNLSALSTNFRNVFFVEHALLWNIIYRSVFLAILWRPDHCTDHTERCCRILQYGIMLPYFNVHVPYIKARI